MDQGSSIIQFIILAVLIILSALFSSSETALMSFSKVQLKKLGDSKRENVLKSLMENTNKLLSTILLGNNLVNIYASALMTSIAISAWGEGSIAITTLILTVVILIFGEIVPKTFAKKNAEPLALKVAYVIKWISIILTPIVFVLEKVSNGFVRILGGNINDDYIVTEEEIKDILEVGSVDGALEEEEKQMIYNVFEFGDMKVKEVMTTRKDIIAIEKNATYDEVMEVFLKQHFSRVPVFDESKDNIIGILYVKDFVFKAVNKDNFNMEELINEPYFTYNLSSISDLFSDMQKRRYAFAVVMDEYGSVDGIVTMEDIIEEIVGEIEDEYDSEEIRVHKVNDNEYIVDGYLKLDELFEDYGINLLKDMFEEEYFSDTVGGLVMEVFGSIPEQDLVIDIGNVKVKIESAESSRINKVRLYLNEPFDNFESENN